MSIIGPETGPEYLRAVSKRLRVLERRPGFPRPLSGLSSERPDPTTLLPGVSFYDLTLRKPIYSDGVSFWFADGTAVPSAT